MSLSLTAQMGLNALLIMSMALRVPSLAHVITFHIYEKSDYVSLCSTNQQIYIYLSLPSSLLPPPPSLFLFFPPTTSTVPSSTRKCSIHFGSHGYHCYQGAENRAFLCRQGKEYFSLGFFHIGEGIRSFSSLCVCVILAKTNLCLEYLL